MDVAVCDYRQRPHAHGRRQGGAHKLVQSPLDAGLGFAPFERFVLFLTQKPDDARRREHVLLVTGCGIGDDVNRRRPHKSLQPRHVVAVACASVQDEARLGRQPVLHGLKQSQCRLVDVFVVVGKVTRHHDVEFGVRRGRQHVTSKVRRRQRKELRNEAAIANGGDKVELGEKQVVAVGVRRRRDDEVVR